MYGLEKFVDEHPVRNARDELELFDILEKRPLTKRILVRVGNRFGFRSDQLAEIYRVMPRTFRRNYEHSALSILASGYVIALIRLHTTGVMAFGGEESFRDWLNRELFTLNYKRPIDLLTSTLGIELVRDEIGRMMHGIPP